MKRQQQHLSISFFVESVLGDILPFIPFVPQNSMQIHEHEEAEKWEHAEPCAHKNEGNVRRREGKTPVNSVTIAFAQEVAEGK